MNTLRLHDSTAPVLHDTCNTKAARNRTLARNVLKQFVKNVKGLTYVTAKDLPRSIGNGCYGYVFSHPTDASKVVKVCWNSPLYIEYATWAFLHSDNPYVPKIDSITLVRNKAKACRPIYRNIAIVVMERLNGCDKNAYAHAYYELQDTWNSDDAPLYVTELKTYLATLKNRLDFHHGNVLCRGDDQPVFTDPVAG